MMGYRYAIRMIIIIIENKNLTVDNIYSGLYQNISKADKMKKILKPFQRCLKKICKNMQNTKQGKSYFIFTQCK